MTKVLSDADALKVMLDEKNHALRQAAVELKGAALLLRPDYPQLSGIFETAARTANMAAR